MKFEWKVALRFLKSGRTQTVFILSGIAIGVAVQIFLGSLITSLQDNLVAETIGSSPHITIKSADDDTTRLLQSDKNGVILLRGNYYPYERNLNNWTLLVAQVEKNAGIRAVSPAVEGTAIVQSAGKDLPVRIKGVQLERADPLYRISERTFEGSAMLDGNRILIGESLAEELGAEEGDNIGLLIPSGETVTFLISGIFDLENESANSGLLFMDLSRAQKLFGSGSGISAIEVQLTDPFSADVVAETWRQSLSDVSVSQWKEENAQLLSALNSQSSSSYTIQFFVILAVTFGISSVLAVSVIQKSREIGILKAMGATKKSASRIFILQGLLLGASGSALGILAGILLLNAFNLFSDLSFVIVWKWKNVLLIAVIATCAGMAASVIPARRSAELNPMEAIKNG